MNLTDRVVIVTGASAGIGEAIARAAVARGAVVVLVARRTELLNRLAAELPKSIAVTADVTTDEGRREMVDTALQAHGRIDVLVNNAGQGLHLPLDQVTADDFRAVLELNVVAPLAATQAVLPAMRAQGGGAIVNISSGTSRMVLPGVGAYAASKSALNMLSDVARAELAPEGIVVSTVYPSLTATDFHDNLRAGSLHGRPGMVPQTPQEVADAVVDVIETGEPDRVLSHRPS